MTIDELKTRQSWTLHQKIDHTVGAVEAFVSALKGKVYIAFSGGIDSTILLDICRRFVDPSMKAVFCNAGNEFPDIVYFTRQTENVITIRPELLVKQVIEKHGFPLVSKEQAYFIWQARNTKSEKLLDRLIHGKKGYTGRTLGKIYNKWQFLINAPFSVSNKCCDYLKKQPFAKYEKVTGERPIIGTMAEESRLRLQSFLRRESCNVLTGGKENSQPLLFWTSSDIWAYRDKFEVPYSPIYDLPGVNSTGCMICGFGADKNIDRFYTPFDLCPKAYEMFMGYENNGVTYREALHYLGIDLPDDLL